TGEDTATDARHHVEVTDPAAWFTAHLGFDPTADVTPADWLATPTQLLAQATAGAVFHDGLHRLAPARYRLRWYPRDLWLHVLACQWRRLAQEEAFVGRCGEVGDDLGSAVVTARLVRDLMRLHLLMNRRYPPYSKWLGSAFARTPGAAELTPHLIAALTAADWRTREHHLCRAYDHAARAHNRLGLTDPVDPTTRPFHDRPFRVLGADRLATALRPRIAAPALRALPASGAVDQYVDNTDVLTRPPLARATALTPPPHPLTQVSSSVARAIPPPPRPGKCRNTPVRKTVDRRTPLATPAGAALPVQGVHQPVRLPMGSTFVSEHVF